MKLKTIFKFIGIIALIFIALIIGLIYFTTIDAKNEARILKAQPLSYSRDIPKDYSQLFNDDVKLSLADDVKLSLSMTTYSKFRNPIAEFYYKKNYYLEIYRIAHVDTLSINNMVEEQFSSSTDYSLGDYLTNVSYRKTPFVIEYKLGVPDTLNKIYFVLGGINSHVLKKSNNIAYYSSNFSYFLIRYNKNGEKDFHGKVKDENDVDNLPLELVFLKRNGNLYLIILTVLNKATKINEGMLYSL
ncbi:MAG: hypothetical protein JWP44_4991, partial [Mucilaginibacter sp.]|nr:hypothetical protein [Mucilaginibacter sp.]